MKIRRAQRIKPSVGITAVIFFSLIGLVSSTGDVLGTGAQAAKKKSPTTRAKAKKTTSMKVKGVVYSLTEEQVLLVKALPDALDKRDLFEATLSNVTIKVSLKRMGVLPGLCVDTTTTTERSSSSGGSCSSSLPLDKIGFTAGSQSKEGQNMFVFSAPHKSSLVVHTTSGDVVPALLGEVPELRLSWFGYQGAPLAADGIETSTPSQLRPYLPAPTQSREDKTNITIHHSDIDTLTDPPTPWSVVEAVSGKQKVFCLDKGKEQFDICTSTFSNDPILNLATREFLPTGSDRATQVDILKKRWQLIGLCKSQIKSVSFATEKGAKAILLQSLPFTDAKYTFFKHPDYGILTVVTRDGKKVQVDLTVEGLQIIFSYFDLQSTLNECG